MIIDDHQNALSFLYPKFNCASFVTENKRELLQKELTYIQKDFKHRRAAFREKIELLSAGCRQAFSYNAGALFAEPLPQRYAGAGTVLIPFVPSGYMTVFYDIQAVLTTQDGWKCKAFAMAFLNAPGHRGHLFVYRGINTKYHKIEYFARRLYTDPIFGRDYLKRLIYLLSFTHTQSIARSPLPSKQSAIISGVEYTNNMAMEIDVLHIDEENGQTPVVKRSS